jgi:hypothetical protein
MRKRLSAINVLQQGGLRLRFQMRRILGFAVLIFVLGTSRLYASTHWGYPYERPFLLQVNGSTRYFMLVGYAEANQSLAWKTTNSNWAGIQNPSGVTSFYLATGLAAATPITSVSGWSNAGPRLYAVAATTPATLYEYAYDLAGNGSWRPLTALPHGSLGNSPVIAAAFAPAGTASPGIWLAVRTAANGDGYDGHLWTCRITAPGAACQWEDETCRGTSGCHAGATNTYPIAINVPALNSETEFYVVQPTGQLHRYRYGLANWDALPLPSVPCAAVIDQNIAARTIGGTTTVVAEAFSGYAGCPPTSSLQATTNTGGAWAAWTFVSGGPQTGGVINRNPNTLYWADDGTYHRIYESDTPLWRCDFNLATLQCSWTNLGSPSDIMLGSPLYDYQNAVGGDVSRAITITAMGLNYVYYLYEHPMLPQISGPTWRNHLSLQDGPMIINGQHNIAEYTAAEYFSAVRVVGNGLSTSWVWQSNDDGSTWTGPVQPFGASTRGDEGLVFDAAGTGFLTASFADGIHITTQPQFATNWTTPFGPIPDTFTLLDRPSLAADPIKPGVLYLTWGSNGGGNMAYCNGSSPCDSAAGWCPDVPLQSNTNCVGYKGSSGCWVTASGDGTIFVGVQDHSSCPIPSGYTAAIGIQAIASNTRSGTCNTITWGPVSCVYYVHQDPRSSQAKNGANGVSYYPRRFSARLSGTPDQYGVALTLQSNRDINTGGQCTTASTNCRSEIYLAYLDNEGQWCGSSSCGSAPLYTGQPGQMLIVNRDQGSLPLPQVDHIQPATAVFDNYQFATTWFDFRLDPTNDTTYYFRTTLSDGSGAGALIPTESSNWSATGGMTYLINGGLTWYGDVDYHASARLHAHTFVEEAGADGNTHPVTLPWAPYAPGH